jgi:Putative peptidoglycan binding domain/L,D-transpeptidase catalytic domain
VPRFARAAGGLIVGCLLVGSFAANAAVATPPARQVITPTPTESPTPTPTPTTASPTAPAPTLATTTPSMSPTATTASPSSSPAAPPPTTTAAPPPTFAGYPQFYRASIKQGDQDVDVYHIKNVRELQYRLRWAGVYTGPVTGYFGSLTKGGVVAFQQKWRLPVTGRVDLRTWQVLIGKTTKRLSSIPPVCKQSGWRSCYDRASHQLFGFYSGKLWNVWLVRGGSFTEQTDVGTWAVYARYVQKISSIYGAMMYYFQKYHGGEGIHGSTTMIDPFVGHSHGCINMYIPDSKVLWNMTLNRRHVVTVYGAWS